MRLIKIAMLPALMIAVMIAAGPAYAGKESTPLPAVGRTIAGPGSLTVGTRITTVWEIDGSATRDVCVTLSNEGNFNVQYVMDVGGFVIEPGRAMTVCAAGQSHLYLACSDVPPCIAQIQWRVDLM